MLHGEKKNRSNAVFYLGSARLLRLEGICGVAARMRGCTCFRQDMRRHSEVSDSTPTYHHLLPNQVRSFAFSKKSTSKLTSAAGQSHGSEGDL